MRGIAPLALPRGQKLLQLPSSGVGTGRGTAGGEATPATWDNPRPLRGGCGSAAVCDRAPREGVKLSLSPPPSPACGAHFFTLRYETLLHSLKFYRRVRSSRATRVLRSLNSSRVTWSCRIAESSSLTIPNSI